MNFFTQQATLKASISFEGITLHQGGVSHLTLHPAGENHGVVFRVKGQSIPALSEFVISTSYCVKLGISGVSIQTVEHLLCALLMNNISNVLCEVDGEEVPILDGSSEQFSAAIQKVGIIEQGSPRMIAKIIKSVDVELNGCTASFSPAEDHRYSVIADYDHPAIDPSTLQFSFSTLFDSYAIHIDKARTYGFTKDQAFYELHNLAQGASVKTALIFDDYDVVNEEGMRMDGEVARHKVLDCIGDLSLLGGGFLGHYKAYRPGHALNVMMVKALIAQNAIQWIEAPEVYASLQNTYSEMSY